MSKYIVGVDEAGRGPLAGPVAVGTVMVPVGFDWGLIDGVTDSKKLSEAKREYIYKVARKLKRAGELNYKVTMIGPKTIDRVGITRAVEMGVERALRRLTPHPRHTFVKLDGLLKAPIAFQYQETIIKGDQKEKVIGLASILAKVTRDRYMVRKSAEPIFAPYTFHIHKGYGTKRHRETIRLYGLSPMHRITFCKNIYT